MSAPLNSKTARELLEAYQSIYMTEEVENITEEPYKRGPWGREFSGINRSASNLMTSGGIGGEISRGFQSAQSRARKALGLEPSVNVKSGEKYGPGDGAAASSKGTIGGLITKKPATPPEQQKTQQPEQQKTQQPATRPATPVAAKPATPAAAKPATPAAAKPSDGAERRTPTMRELRAAQAARAAGKSEKDVVQAGIAAGKAERLAKANVSSQYTSRQDLGKTTGIGAVKTGAASTPSSSKPQSTSSQYTNRQDLGKTTGIGAVKTGAASTPSSKPQPTKKSRLDTALSGIGKWNEEVSPYDMVIDYLFSEGHVASVEEAHYVMLEMDQETIQGICERYEDVMEADKKEKKDKKIKELIDRAGTGNPRYDERRAGSSRVKGFKFTTTEEVEAVDEGLTGERYKAALKKGKMYSRKVSEDPAKRATRGGRGGESDFGAGDRGAGNKAARRAGTYQEENFELWVNGLVEEGYNLSDYTWDEMYEFYLDELYKGKHGQSEEDYMDSRSDAGKQISGDRRSSGAEYSHRSYRGVGKPAKPGERQKNQGRMTQADRDELKIRKANLKKRN